MRSNNRARPSSATVRGIPGHGLGYTSTVSSYERGAVAGTLQRSEVLREPSRVLVITHEPLRQNLSGPGVRALEMARALADRHEVTIATPFPPEIADVRCTFAEYSFDRPKALKMLAERAGVVVVQGFTLSQFPFLALLHVPIVVDLYCPFTIEHLEMLTSRPGVADALALARAVKGETPEVNVRAIEIDAAGVLAVQNTQLVLGDFFICASERQRDFWIGALHTAGRINPRTYAGDPTMRSLIDVVPFGLPDQRFDQPAASVLKGVRPGIRASDHLLLWGGSILDWQDPQTLVRAVASIAAHRADIKLFFMGTRHPNPQIPPMRAVQEAVTLARDLGVLDTHVFFNDWVPYTDRWRYLIEADLGLSTHRDHLETHLSFRTRMLDYLWTGLPIVCTEGDVFASLVAERGLGRVVRPGDPGALASAIEALIDDKDERARCRRRLLEVAEEFRWRRVVAPLARFCDAPRCAPDGATARRALHRRLARSFRLVRWAKRGALAMGVSETRVEQVKELTPVRMAMGWLNRLAIAGVRREMPKPRSSGWGKN
jgi:glycosyltransferase involved in cell wall biosynthesis